MRNMPRAMANCEVKAKAHSVFGATKLFAAEICAPLWILSERDNGDICNAFD